jgi:hypothetical protein
LVEVHQTDSASHSTTFSGCTLCLLVMIDADHGGRSEDKQNSTVNGVHKLLGSKNAKLIVT